MTKDEIRKLIGGYASGTLTAEERAQLFEQALQDQDLFDELQTEQPLKELLDDPFSREQIRRVAAESLPRAKRGWYRTPWIWAIGGSLAAAALIVTIVAPWRATEQQFSAVARMEKLQVPQAVAAPPPVETRKDVTPAKPAHSLGRAIPASPGTPPKTANVAAEDSPAPTSAAEPAQVQVASAHQQPAVPPGGPSQTAQNAVMGGAGASQMSQAQNAPPPAAQTTQPPMPTQQVQVQVEAAPAVPVAKQAVQAKAKLRDTDELARPVKAFGNTAALPRAALLAGQRGPIYYRLSRRLADGTYVDLPNNTVFGLNEPVRVTVFPRATGTVLVEEWDASTAAWKRVELPPPVDTSAAEAAQRYGVPIDITVKKNERLRVTVGDNSLIINIPNKEQ